MIFSKLKARNKIVPYDKMMIDGTNIYVTDRFDALYGELDSAPDIFWVAFIDGYDILVVSKIPHAFWEEAVLDRHTIFAGCDSLDKIEDRMKFEDI